MNYKVGETLHRCHIDCDTGRASYYEHVVRSKRGGKFHAVCKTSFTWVKLKWGKDQTRGWASHIPDYCRDSCQVGEKFQFLHRTKQQALKQAKRFHAERKKRRANREQAS